MSSPDRTVAAPTVPSRTAVLLRLEVGRFRARESRRVFDFSVHVGVLGGPRESFTVPARDQPGVDDALRTDIVAALLEGTPAEYDVAWLVRPGDVERHDEDPRWLAAATRAFGMHGRDLAGFYVLTRTGWRDGRSGDSRVWRRLRL